MLCARCFTPQLASCRKSKTLNQVGAELVASGRSACDLTLEDIMDMDPFMLPPKMRGRCTALASCVEWRCVAHHGRFARTNRYCYVCPTAQVAAMKKPNPIYQKESQKCGAKAPTELEKNQKYLPKTQTFTKVIMRMCVHSRPRTHTHAHSLPTHSINETLTHTRPHSFTHLHKAHNT